MNNTFNYSRFGMLFRKHTVENYKSYLMSAVVLCGATTLLYAFIFLMDGYRIRYDQRGVFFVFLYLSAGVIFTSTVFAKYGKRGSDISSLILPASHFEKFLVGWIYSLLIFTAVFLICFYAIDSAFMTASRFPDEQRIFNIFSPEHKFYVVFFIFAFLHAVVLYGAVFFRSMHFIKTACIFFAVVLILSIVNTQLLKILIPENIFFNPPLITGARFMLSPADYVNIALPESVQKHFIQFLSYAMTLILWTAAFFRLKETQV